MGSAQSSQDVQCESQQPLLLREPIEAHVNQIIRVKEEQEPIVINRKVYVIEKELQSGGFGTVWIGRDKDENKVAIKSFKSKHAFKEEKASFDRIMRTGLPDLCERIVCYKGYAKEDGEYFIVMDLVPNGFDLFELVDLLFFNKFVFMMPSRIEMYVKVALVQKMLEAGHALMDEGIYHRDYKLENFMVYQTEDLREDIIVWANAPSYTERSFERGYDGMSASTMAKSNLLLYRSAKQTKVLYDASIRSNGDLEERSRIVAETFQSEFQGELELVMRILDTIKIKAVDYGFTVTRDNVPNEVLGRQVGTLEYMSPVLLKAVRLEQDLNENERVRKMFGERRDPDGNKWTRESARDSFDLNMFMIAVDSWALGVAAIDILSPDPFLTNLKMFKTFAKDYDNEGNIEKYFNAVQTQNALKNQKTPIYTDQDIRDARSLLNSDATNKQVEQFARELVLAKSEQNTRKYGSRLSDDPFEMDFKAIHKKLRFLNRYLYTGYPYEPEFPARKFARFFEKLQNNEIKLG